MLKLLCMHTIIFSMHNLPVRNIMHFTANRVFSCKYFFQHLKIFLCSFRTIDVKRSGVFRSTKCLYQPWQAEHMVTMPVRNKDFRNYCWLYSCAAQLSLYAFAAIEQQSFAFIDQQHTRMVSLFCRLHTARAQKN